VTGPTHDLEDRLRRTLTAVAETTETDTMAEEWAGAGAGNRSGTAHRAPLLDAAVVVVVALVGVALALASDDDGADVIADETQEGSGYSVPTVLPDGVVPTYAWRGVPEQPDGEPPAADRVRVFGERGDDGLLVRAVAVVEVENSFMSILNGLTTTGRREATAGGSTVHLDRVPDTGLALVTSPASDVALLGFGVADDALLGIIGPLLADAGGTDAVDRSKVPAGMEQLYDGPSRPLEHADDSDTELLVVDLQDVRQGRLGHGGFDGWQMSAFRGEPPSSVVSELLAGRNVSRLAVGDLDVVLFGGAPGSPDRWGATWQERPGVTVSISGSGATDDVPAIVAGVQEVDAARWRAFASGAEEAAEAAEERGRRTSVEDDFVPSGPGTEVAVGAGNEPETYTLTPGTSAGGEEVVCADSGRLGAGTFCMPRQAPHPAVIVDSWGTSGNSTYVVGLADAAVARVVVEGPTADVEVAPAGAEAGHGVVVFAADLPPQDGLVEVAGYDEDGNEVLRTRLVMGS
jgi:hypothetical protein